MIRRAWQRAVCTAIAHLARTSVYLDPADWWVGLYRDQARSRYYVCPLPCLVVRYQAPGRAVNPPATVAGGRQPEGKAK